MSSSRSLPALALAVLLSLAAACQQPEPPAPEDATAPATAQMEAAAAVIDAATLRDHIAFLASDALEGRGPGSEGDEAARAYLKTTMEEIGLAPAFGQSWEQPFDIVGITAALPETWRFEAGDETLELARGEAYMASSGVQEPRAAIDSAEIVFVGYGIQAPEYEWDDYKGADLSGKVLLMLNNDPDWDPALFEGDRRLYYGRWTYKYEIAAEQGAVGAIVIHTTPSAGYPWQVVRTSWSGEQFELPAEDEPRLQVEAWVTEESAQQLVELAGRDLAELTESARSRDFTPVPLGITTSLELDNELSREETANVGGLLGGRDPELSRQLVVYTAHHDHLGIGEPDESGDRIYNGALDNASGTAGVLAIARAFTRLEQPPRRSILFLFVGAEEQGLLGSEYYARHPSVEPGRIAANINLDGANIWGETEDLTYIGYGKSSLGRVVERLAEAQGRTVRPDQFPDRGFFYRSDQFNFAKIGVPAIYLDTGTDFVGRPEGWGRERIEEWEAQHYHQPSDELVDDWSFAGMVEDDRLLFYCGVRIANADRMPSWTPGDEFADEREAALAAVGTGSPTPAETSP